MALRSQALARPRAVAGRHIGHSGTSVAAARWQHDRCARLVAANAAASAAATDKAAPAAAGCPAAQLDIRVGVVSSCERHPDADSLFVEQVDVGEPEPRTIVSGLVQYVPLEEMQGRRVVVLCNLKPRNMRGVKSNGMLLCASNDAHNAVEPLEPPASAVVGERAWFGEGGQEQGPPAELNRIQKKKVWEAVQPELKTGPDGIAGYKGQPMLTSTGPIRAPTLKGANIS